MYTETFKKKLVEQMLMPNRRPMAMLARETGVAEATMYRWRNEATKPPPATTKPGVYTETFKKKLVEQMLMPNRRPMAMLAREAGVAETTMYRWRNEATKPPHTWTPKEKLAVVLEAAAVPEAELGAFLRRKRVHEAQLMKWRKQVTEGAVSALRGAARGVP